MIVYRFSIYLLDSFFSSIATRLATIARNITSMLGHANTYGVHKPLGPII